MISFQCKLKLLDVAAVRMIEALVAEYDYVSAKQQIEGKDPQRTIRLHDLAILFSHAIAEWCKGSIEVKGVTHNLDYAVERADVLLNLETKVLADIARGMVGLAEDEAKKSGAASPVPFEVKPAQ